MTEQCILCQEEKKTTFLEKPLGTYLKNSEGKKVFVCSSCQKQHQEKLQEQL